MREKEELSKRCEQYDLMIDEMQKAAAAAAAVVVEQVVSCFC